MFMFEVADSTLRCDPTDTLLFIWHALMYWCGFPLLRKNYDQANWSFA
jgi:hypothetical protein